MQQTPSTERYEFPEWERRRSGRFQNGAGPEGGYAPELINTEIHISRAIRAQDWCAVDYFRAKLWTGIAYMHYAARVPPEARVMWEIAKQEEGVA
jgi:hypothetical protein